MAVLQRKDVGGTFILTATADPASAGANALANLDIDVADVANAVNGSTSAPLMTTDTVQAIPPATYNAGLYVQRASVLDADTIRVVVANTTAGALDAASGTWTFIIHRV